MRVRLKDAALLTLPTLTHAVSLSDWTPRAMNLPRACEKLYTQPIAGCTVHDFSTRHCSTACVQGLEALVGPIKQACGGHGVTGENLIVAFLADVGPQQICPNAPHWTAGPSSAGGAWPSSSGAPSPHHTHHWPGGEPTITSGTSTASSLPPGETSSLVVDTSRKPNTVHYVSPKTSASTTTASSSSNPQLNTHDGSGGGSPFDTQGNLMDGAASLSLSAGVILFSAAVALFNNLR